MTSSSDHWKPRLTHWRLPGGRRSAAWSGRQCRGFSLPELLLVVAILAVLGSLAYVSSGNLNRSWRLRSAAIELAGYLRTARQTALKDEAICTITIGANGAVGPLAGTACDGEMRQWNVGNDATVQGLNLAGPATVTFNPLGLTAAATETVLTAADGGGGRQWCVRVSQPLGIVRVGSRPDANATCNYSRGA